MLGNLLGRQPVGEDAEKGQSENINWLPRSRLRSGGRGDFLLTALMVAAVSVVAAAAGYAAWTRHGGGDVASSSTSPMSEKPPERAIVARAPPAPAAPQAPAAIVAPPPAPVRNVSAVPAAPAAPSSDFRAPTAPSAPPAVVVSTDSSGAPVVRAAPPPQPAQTPPPTEIAPQPVSPPTPVAPAPFTNFSAGAFEVLPPLAGVEEWAPPAAAPAAPAAPARSEPSAPRDLTRAAPPPERTPAVSNPPAAPQRTAALTPPPAPGAKVSVYLDEYPDQKAAAAALSQKSGAYGKAIGSGGKLTYTRRNGDSWRLRVSNLDQAAAEAMCVRLRSAGAPCSVGPN